MLKLIQFLSTMSAVARSPSITWATLSKLITHTSPLMTERYAHLRDEALQKAGQVCRQVV